MPRPDPSRERLLAILGIARAYRQGEISFQEMQSRIARVKGRGWRATTRGRRIWILVGVLLAGLLAGAVYLLVSA